MTFFRTTLRLKHMERIPMSVPVDKRSAMGISHKEYQEISKRPGRFEFLGNRPEITKRPETSPVPNGMPDLRRMSVGSVLVIGYLSESERRRVGWSRGPWLVKCRCGRYENRAAHQLRRPSDKEYVDACTFCKNAWAEAVMLEFKKTGRIPPGGLPTHSASQLIRRGKSPPIDGK